ncbi:MAG: NIPSNAP family containing protein [Inquilinus sp.]|nr:NIPSNAP family containing protein [Inquilinus sp.]
MALYELRQYKVRDGQMSAWLDLMEGEIIPYVVSKGMVFTASFRAEDDPSVYVWIRRFEDEADRERLYAKVYESEHWKSDLSPRIGDLLIREEAIIHRLVPTRLSPMQ